MHMHPGRAGLRRDDLRPKSAQHGLKYPRGVVATTHPNVYPPDPQDNGPPADTSVRQGSDEHPLYENKTVAAIPKQTQRLQGFCIALADTSQPVYMITGSEFVNMPKTF